LPKAKISWLLNGKELTLKDNVKFETDPKTSSNNLIIPKINQAVHLGKYTIKASNSVGEVEHIFDLDVLGILNKNVFVVIQLYLILKRISFNIAFNKIY
jgi:hypothetical protein